MVEDVVPEEPYIYIYTTNTDTPFSGPENDENNFELFNFDRQYYMFMMKDELIY